MKRLIEEINDVSEIREAPDGRAYRSLSSTRAQEISRKSGCSCREVEIEALRAHIVPERYQRNLGSVGMEGQAKLLQSRVGVIGVGGLGEAALELLLRVGVGEITLVEGDTFSESNLNRQFLSSPRNIGVSKVDAACRRAEEINPSTKIQAFCAWANAGNLAEMIRDCQVVVDGLDDIGARYALQRVARGLGVPLVHGAVAGFWGQVMTIFPEDKGLESVYGSESGAKPGDEKELGTPCVTPVAVASVQVSEVIKILLGWEHTIRNRLLVFNLKNMESGFLDLG